jgi:hypothetical protein
VSIDRRDLARVIKEQQGGISPQMWPIRISPAELGISLNSAMEIQINPCDLLWMPSTYDKSYGPNPYQTPSSFVSHNCVDPTVAGQNICDLWEYATQGGYASWYQQAPVFALRFNTPNNPWVLFGLSTLMTSEVFGSPAAPPAVTFFSGTAVLTNGFATVTNPKTPAINNANWTLQNVQVQGQQGDLSLAQVFPGTSFGISSSDPLDNSVISWSFRLNATAQSFGNLATPFGQTSCMRSITGPITRLWIQFYRWAVTAAGTGPPFPPNGPNIPASQVVLMSMLGYGHLTSESSQQYTDSSSMLGGVMPSVSQTMLAGNTYLTPQLNAADRGELPHQQQTATP